MGLPLISDGMFRMAKRGSAYFADKHARYGEIYKERLFFGKAVVVSGYDHVRKIMRGEHDLTEGKMGPGIRHSMWRRLCGILKAIHVGIICAIFGLHASDFRKQTVDSVSTYTQSPA